MVWKSLCGYILSWYKVQLPRRLEGSYEPRSFLSRMEVCLLSTELEVQGFAALRILRKARVPWVPAWPRQSVGHRACASSTPPLWERQGDRSLGRFENWFKVTSPVSGGTRIPTEICFTCLHVYLLDFHIGRTGWWPSPLSWVNFPPNSSFFSEFLPATRSCNWLSLQRKFSYFNLFLPMKVFSCNCFGSTVMDIKRDLNLHFCWVFNIRKVVEPCPLNVLVFYMEFSWQ